MAGRLDRAWVASLALVVALALADLLLGRAVSVVGTLAVAPFVASALTTARRTAVVGALACASAVTLSLYDDVTRDAGAVRVAAVVAGSVLAVGVAQRRQERERRLADVTRVADVAQRAILAPVPTATGPFAFASAYVSASREAAVGGDLLDVVLTDGDVRLIVGDVRGKGLDAVRLAAMTLALFREKAVTLPTLSRVATLLETRLAPHLGPEDFVTAVLASIGWGGQLQLINCGHPAPLLVRDGIRQLLEPAEPTTPFGLGPDPAVATFQLRVGDRVLFYTDGLIEARAKRHTAPVPLEALTQAVGTDSFDSALDTVLALLRDAVGGRLHDDLALLLVEFRATDARGEGDGADTPADLVRRLHRSPVPPPGATRLRRGERQRWSRYASSASGPVIVLSSHPRKSTCSAGAGAASRRPALQCSSASSADVRGTA